jgi:hypothetical protein
VARTPGTAGLNAAIYLGQRAAVTEVKALTKCGEPAKAKAVNFATPYIEARYPPMARSCAWRRSISFLS